MTEMRETVEEDYTKKLQCIFELLKGNFFFRGHRVSRHSHYKKFCYLQRPMKSQELICSKVVKPTVIFRGAVNFERDDWSANGFPEV